MTISPILVCTVLEAHYLPGLKAFVNSLVVNGFRGTIAVGYKGRIAERTIEEIGQHSGLSVRFIRIEQDVHLANFKPHFMLNCIEMTTESNFDRVCYFDPDIVLLASWTLMESCTRDVIAVCEDINSPLSKHHPLHRVWNSKYSDYPIVRTIETYANSGFISVPVKEHQFLRLWQHINDNIYPCSRHELLGQACDRSFDVCKSDQDALNIALERSAVEFSCLDRSAMMFSIVGTGAIMAHAIGSPKPWNTNFLVSAMKGMPASPPAKQFFKYVDKPIPVFGVMEGLLKKFCLFSSILIGRFYRR